MTITSSATGDRMMTSPGATGAIVSFASTSNVPGVSGASGAALLRAALPLVGLSLAETFVVDNEPLTELDAGRESDTAICDARGEAFANESLSFDGRSAKFWRSSAPPPSGVRSRRVQLRPERVPSSLK